MVSLQNWGKYVLRDEGLLELKYSDLTARLWNCDETGLCTSVTSTKVIADPDPGIFERGELTW